jgi:pimeloyl-ACP methyl ester carboxylesterase
MEVEVQSASIYVNHVGSGIPTLFLHGNPDSGELWQPIIDRVQDQFACYAPDLPGYGRSQAPAQMDLSLEGMARFIDELVGAAQIPTPLNLVMHDFGGPFGLPWAIRHPEKVQRLVISNTVFNRNYTWHPTARLLRIPVVGELINWITPRTAYINAVQAAAPKLDRAYAEQMYDGFHAEAKRMALRLYRATDPANYAAWEGELHNLTASVPTLVIWGDRDPFADAHFADQFGAQEVIHLADVGHWVPREAAEEFAAALRRFAG